MIKQARQSMYERVKARVYAVGAMGLMLTLLALAIPSTVSAVDPFDTVCQGRGAGSTACTSRTTADPVSNAIGDVTSILALVVGIVSVIFIVIGGIKYITSNGDSSRVATAKSTIIYALIGLLTALLARPLINLVLGRL